MPNVKSAEKAARQNEKRRTHNRALRSTMRTSVKTAVEAAAGTDTKAAEESLRAAMSQLGKAGKKNLVHPRKASRLASRLQKRVNKIKAGA